MYSKQLFQERQMLSNTPVQRVRQQNEDPKLTTGASLQSMESPRFNEDKIRQSVQSQEGKPWEQTGNSQKQGSILNQMQKDQAGSLRAKWGSKKVKDSESSDSSSENSFDRELSSRLKLLEAKKHIAQFDQDNKSIQEAESEQKTNLIGAQDYLQQRTNSLPSQVCEKDEKASNISHSLLRASRLDESENQGNDDSSIQGINSRFQNSTLYSRYSFLDNEQSRNLIQQHNYNNENDLSAVSDKKNISRTIYNHSNSLKQSGPQTYTYNNNNNNRSSSQSENLMRQQKEFEEKQLNQYSSMNKQIKGYSNKQVPTMNLQMHGEGEGEISQILSKEEQLELEISAFSQSEANSSMNIANSPPQIEQEFPTLSQETEGQYKGSQFLKGVISNKDKPMKQNYNFSSQPKQQNQKLVQKQQEDEIQFEQQEENRRHLFLSDQSEDSHRIRDQIKNKRELLNQRNEQNHINQFRDIIQDSISLKFIQTRFPNHAEIFFIDFLEALEDEFETLLSFQEEREKGIFQEEMQRRLTTSDPNLLSLNALHIFTRDINLKEKIRQLLAEIRIDRQEYEDNESDQQQEIRTQQKRNEKGDDQKSDRSNNNNNNKKREDNSSTTKKETNINEQIYNEIHSLSKVLEKKSRELELKEKNLEARQKDQEQKEINFRSILKGEMEIMILSLDEAIKERTIEVNKKVANLDKQMRTKVKILEAKAKEVKNQSTTSASQNDKLKAKLAANEKATEFLKIKAQDAEKKLINEQDRANQTQTKYDNLLKKHKELEKKIKELEYGVSQLSNQQIMSPDQNTLNSFAPETMRRQQQHSSCDPPSPIRGESLEDDEFKIGEATINEINSAFPSNLNIQNQQISGLSQQWNIPTTKKKSSVANSSIKKKLPIGQMGSQTTSAEEEVKVLMAVVQTITSNLRTTLPLMMSLGGKEDMIGLNESSIDITMAIAKNSAFDIGEVFYPCFNNLIGNLVEIVPSLLTRPCNQKNLYNTVNLMFKTISFKLRYGLYKSQDKTNKNLYKKQIFSDELLESSRTIMKSGQDHINEIMMNPKKPTELTFIPQTSYWKRKIKILPKKTVSDKMISTSLQQSQQIGFQLFNNEDIQKELVSVFKKYIDSSEQQLKRLDSQKESPQQQQQIINVQSENAASITFENQKYILLTRIDLVLMTLILQVNSKESASALQCLLMDISGGNENLNDSLRNYIVNQSCVSILAWRMSISKEDPIFLGIAVDLLLHMNQNGSHYKQFIEDVSNDSVISKLIGTFERFDTQKDITEKLSVILQRITVHNNNLKDRLSQKQIAVFKSKLQEAERSKFDCEFLIQNLQSILKNIQQ